MGTGSFPEVKSGRGVTLTPHPFYCRGQDRVELYLYLPYGPYGLYRASVPVQGCTLPYFFYFTLYHSGLACELRCTTYYSDDINISHDCCTTITQINTGTTLLICIREVTGSHPGQATHYPDGISPVPRASQTRHNGSLQYYPPIIPT